MDQVRLRRCRKGHEYRGDENYRARSGKCPVCFREAQRRYDQSDKGRERRDTYNISEKGKERQSRYWQSPRGWKQRLNERRRLALIRKANRKAAPRAEDQGGHHG